VVSILYLSSSPYTLFDALLPALTLDETSRRRRRQAAVGPAVWLGMVMPLELLPRERET